MSVGDGGDIENEVALRMPSDQIATRRKAILILGLFVVLLIVDQGFGLVTLLALGRGPGNFERLNGGWTEGPLLHDKLIAMRCIDGVQHTPSSVLFLNIWLEVAWRIDEF